MTDKPIFYGCHETEAATFWRSFIQVMTAYIVGISTGLFLAVAAVKFLA
jgi:hypothetical protein